MALETHDESADEDFYNCSTTMIGCADYLKRSPRFVVATSYQICRLSSSMWRGHGGLAKVKEVMLGLTGG